mmetsp:Transcript_14172/g.21275  ORF Transcript_14172/g.21275 Transcript_14172/m.21275 type:complete len:124 (+) Transcript_14172:216-587(+)
MKIQVAFCVTDHWTNLIFYIKSSQRIVTTEKDTQSSLNDILHLPLSRTIRVRQDVGVEYFGMKLPCDLQAILVVLSHLILHKELPLVETDRLFPDMDEPRKSTAYTSSLKSQILFFLRVEGIF